MQHYCTYFDSNYLLRGLTLFRSLEKHGGEFTLWVLCCDDAAFEAVQKLASDELRPVKLDEFEAFEPRLQAAKAQRTRVEYLWTLSPFWPLYVLDKNPKIEMITYLDADLFFYASPAPVFEEIAGNSIALFSHRLPDATKHMEINGIYNVGWLTFRRDANGLACLQQWAEQCLNWCYDRVEPGLYADQKYLDAWPKDFDKVRVLQLENAGIAPWNWKNYSFDKKDDTLLCNGKPLVFFHFHGLRLLNSWIYDPFFSGHIHGAMPPHLRRWLFGSYLRAMIETARWARAQGCRVEWGYLPTKRYIASFGVRIFANKLLKRHFALHRNLK